MNENVKNAATGLATATLIATAGLGVASPQSAPTQAFADTGSQAAVEQAAQAARALSTVQVSRTVGTFAFTQTELTPISDIARAMSTAPQYLCDARAQTGDTGALAANPLAWSIEVSGAVEHPFEATIEQMIDEASQTVIMGCSCAGNPADGLASINAEVTGIAVAELLNHAQPSANANTIVFTSADGYEVALPLRYVLQHYCPIVFDVNGSPIAESMGGTNQLWLGSTSARYFARDIVKIELQVRDVVPAAPGSGDAGEAAANLPNVGVYFGGEVR